MRNLFYQFSLIFTIVVGTKCKVYSQVAPNSLIWSNLTEFQCKQNKESCFEKAKIYFDQFYIPYVQKKEGRKLSDLDISPTQIADELGVGRSLLQSYKTELVVVIVPGLFGSDEQFRGLAHHFAKLRQNVIHVVLPGHGLNWTQAPDTGFDQWRDYLRKVIRAAQHLGKKLIIFGQSTGGVIAVNQAIEEPDLVHGLILMEPALKVQDNLIGISCMARYLARFAHDFPNLASAFGYNPKTIPKSVAPNMACEATKIRSRIFQKLGLDDASDNPNAIASLAEKIKVPTLVLNSPVDTVVNPLEVRTFALHLVLSGKGKYFEYPRPAWNHGLFNQFDSKKFFALIDTFIDDNFEGQRLVSETKEREQIEARLRQLPIVLQTYGSILQLVREYVLNPKPQSELLHIKMSMANHFYRAERLYYEIDRWRNQISFENISSLLVFLPSTISSEISSFLPYFEDSVAKLYRYEQINISNRTKIHDQLISDFISGFQINSPPPHSENFRSAFTSLTDNIEAQISKSIELLKIHSSTAHLGASNN